VPLRLRRLAQAAAVVGLASAPLAGFCVSAHADSWRQSEWWLGKLHVVQAWHSSSGAGVMIAVLADGVDANQADLTGRVISGPDFTGSKRSPGGRDYGVIGTGLASLIAGHGHGSKDASGIHGIAAQATILSVRVTLSPGDPLWSNTRLTSRLPNDIAAGIRYAVRRGARVIALPADPGMPGIAGYGGVRAAAGGSAAEQAAVSYALHHNVVLVAPAGDNAQSGDAPNYPAAYKGVIAVGAFDRNFVKAPYSSHQRYVTLTSAGSGVAMATPAGYRTMNSTWAASSIVAGVSALVRSDFPSLTVPEVVKAMTAGTFYKPQGGALGSGYGTVDAAKAIADATSMSPPQARPAAFGALPRRPPVVPPVPTTGGVIIKDLVTDAIISAAALAALLVPIMWYGSIVRRRDREFALAGADRGRPGRPGTGGMLADPLLEYFGPQDAPAAVMTGSGSRPGPRYQPRPALTGRSTLTSAFAPRPLPAPHAESGPAGGAPRSDAWANAYREPGYPSSGNEAWTAPAQRYGQADDQFPGQPSGHPPAHAGGQMPGHPTLRHAPVSGSPPWEPAPPPTGDLPWAVYPGPAPSSLGGPVAPPTRQGPPESLWGSAAAAPPMSESDTADGPDERPDARRSDSAGRPIYIWNPDTSADRGAFG
jgi:Subtilase family